MERTLLINFPANLRDVRNWHHLGDVAISADGRFAPIMLKKSFLADERKFLGLLMRFVRGNVRDHIDSTKNDHGPSQLR
jgi:hypothetical protein